MLPNVFVASPSPGASRTDVRKFARSLCVMLRLWCRPCLPPGGWVRSCILSTGGAPHKTDTQLFRSCVCVSEESQRRPRHCSEDSL